MHGGRKFARGALPSKIQPVAYAFCHDIIVLSPLRAHTYTAVGPIHQGVLAPPCATCLQTTMQESGPHSVKAILAAYSHH